MPRIRHLRRISCRPSRWLYVCNIASISFFVSQPTARRSTTSVSLYCTWMSSRVRSSSIMECRASVPTIGSSVASWVRVPAIAGCVPGERLQPTSAQIRVRKSSPTAGVVIIIACDSRMFIFTSLNVLCCSMDGGSFADVLGRIATNMCQRDTQ